MKVLWFSGTPMGNEIKGDGNWVISLASTLADKQKIELHVVFKSGNKYIKTDKIGRIIIHKIPCVEFSKFKNDFLKFFNFDVDKNIVNKYFQVINDVNPDLIQLFGFEHDHIELLNQKLNIPIVVHIQCIYQTVYRKWFSGISEIDLRKYSSFKAKLTRNTFKHQYIRHIRKLNKEKLSYKNCKYLIGRTEWDKRGSNILSNNAKYFYCDEILREGFYKNKWDKNFDGDTINIISVFGNSIIKGLDTIIESLEILEHNTKYNIIWRVIGLSEKDELVKICKNKYRDKFNNSIKLLNKLNALQIIEYMEKSDIFVHPSYIENSSNAISEAMLLGMPIIATFAGGTNTLIEDRVTGYLIQAGDPLALAGLIVEVYQDFQKAKILGKNARKVALKRYNPEKISRKLINIYEKILNNVQIKYAFI